MNPWDQRHALEKLVRDHPLVQFGQPHSDSIMYGGHSTGCVHVELQRAEYLWNGNEITVDRISEIAGYTDSQLRNLEGLTATQVRKVITHLKLPYGLQYHGDADGVYKAVRKNGPALLAVRYEMYPQLEDGDHYTGGHPTGSPNGYAKFGGRSDLGFTEGHMVTVLAGRWRKDLNQRRPRVCDPDHGSAARPEIFPYDIMTGHQFDILVESGKRQFGAVVAYLPTRKWAPAGK